MSSKLRDRLNMHVKVKASFHTAENPPLNRNGGRAFIVLNSRLKGGESVAAVGESRFTYIVPQFYILNEVR